MPERPGAPHAPPGTGPDRPAPRSPHVCFLTSSAPLGPDDTYSPFILDLARRMSGRGFRITILMPHVRGSATREVLEGVTVRRHRYLPSPSAETLGLGGGMLPGLRERKLDAVKLPALLWGQIRALPALHTEDPIHLLHSHWLIPQGVVGGRFAASRDLPHVATAHGSDVLGLRFPGMALALRYAVRRSRLVTVNSRAMEAELRSRAAGGEIRVVPFGARATAPDAVEDNLELRRALPGGGPVVGFVGRVVEEKGIREYLRAIATLRDEGVSVVGLVVGGGGGREEARELARRLGIDGAVRFVGSVPPGRVPRYMSVMDALVVPSRYEAQGLVAIEAMLLAVPVVAFATGGLREVVVDGRTGLAVSEGDVPGLVRTVRRLLVDADLRRSLGVEARDVATRRFTLDATVDRFESIYRSLLSA